MHDQPSDKSTASQAIAPDENPTPPTIDYWHVWTDQDGVSHQSRCKIQDFIEKTGFKTPSF